MNISSASQYLAYRNIASLNLAIFINQMKQHLKKLLIIRMIKNKVENKSYGSMFLLEFWL